MTGIRITKRQLSMVSVAIVVSMLTQWLLIPKIQWNNRVYAEGETPYPSQSISSDIWNYSTIMAYGTDYGLICNIMNKGDHTETTYATNVFNYVDGSKNDDIDFISRPAHFMVGSLTPGSGLNYGNTSSATESCPEFFIEAPSDVLATFNRMSGFNISDENIHLIARTPEEIDANITAMRGRARDAVTTAGTRSAAGSDYAFPSSCIISGYDPTDLTSYVRVNGTSMNVVLDDNYADKVVYIDVTQDMLQAFAHTDGLSITKPDSTVVCFNFPETLSSYSDEYDIFLNQFRVNGVSSVTGPNGTDTGDPHDTIDSAICQTILWSIPSDREVGVRCIGGMLLAPDSHVYCVNGPSCGWIVADEIDVKCEFHFIYQNTSEATLGEFSFYLNKKLTEEFGCNPDYSAATRPAVVESTTAALRGQFSFIWQEYTDDTYSTAVGSSQTISNGSGADAIAAYFPVLTFFSDEAHATDHYYVAKNSSKTFYFRITEDQTLTTEGITNSAGYVDLALTVVADSDGKFTFSVVCDSFTGEPGDVFQYNHYDGSVTGSQFYIGSFFNRIDDTVQYGTLVLNKSVIRPSSFTRLGADRTFYFLISREIGGVTYYYNAAGARSTSPIEVPITVREYDAGANVSISLPVGDYTITEVRHAETDTLVIPDYNPGNPPTYLCLSSIAGEGDYSISNNSRTDATITNTYTFGGFLQVTKDLTDGTSAINAPADTTFTFNVFQGTDTTVTPYTTISVTVPSGSSTATSTPIPVPQGDYTIVEVTPGSSMTGYTFSSVSPASAAVTVGSGNTSESTAAGTSFTNTYTAAPTTGTLVIEKTVNGINGAAGSGPDLSLIDPITFTVSGPDSALIGSIPELSAATVTSGDWVRIINTNTYRYVINVPLTAGDIYTVTESSDGHNSSYSVTTSCTPSDGRVTIVGGDEAAATFVNTYTQAPTYEGSLVIRKTITGADLTQIGTISFAAVGTGSTSGSLTIPDLTTSNVGTTVGTNWIDEGNGLYTFTVSGLEQGATYRVEETADGHNSSYDVTVTPSGKVVNVTIPTDTTADTSINADFANDYSPVAAPTGTLVVTKTVTGATAPSGTTYYVVLTSGSTYYNLDGTEASSAADAVQSISVTGNSGTITYDGLDLSKTYTVTETNSSGVAINGSTSVPSAISGYDWTSTGSTIVAPASAFDTTTHQATARITNNYESTAAPTGTLVVTKSITGGATAPSGTNYYVVLTSDGGSVYYDLHGNVVADAASAVQTISVTGTSGSITYDGLDLSKTYTVTETNSSGVAISATNTPSAITGYDWTSTGSTIVAPASAFDTTTHQATATIVNNYAQQSTTVELTVEKVVSGCPSAASRTFGFYLHDETNQYYDENGAEVQQPHAIPFSVNGPAVINLPAGHSYTVEETGANQPYSPVITGYDLQNPTYMNNGVNLPDPGDSATIVVTNTYTQQTGSLEVSKVLTAPSGASITGPFYFYVQDGNNNFLQNDGTFATAANYFSVDAGSTPFTLSGIPVGTYTITEITAPNAANTAYRAGYNLLTTYTGSGVTNVNTLTISKNLTSEAVINNTYTVAGAELTVEKVVSGGPSSAASRAFGFYLHDENNQYYDENGDPVAAATAIEFSVNTPAVISGLPAGHTYTVVETGSGQPFNPVISGYDLQTTYSDPNGVRLANDGDTATTTVTNAYTQQVTPQIGDLVLHKTVDATFTMPATATFTFYVQGADGLFYDENGLYSTTAVPITVHYGTDVTIYGIPAQTYTVWEDVTGDMHAAPNYTFDANGSTTRTTATVPDGLSDTATITNKYQQNAPTTGTLVVTKVVTGDTSITGPFSFTVTNAAGEYLQAQDTGLFGSTEVTFSVVAGGSVSFTNIPDGVVCTVTETDADSFGPVEGGSTTSGSATIVAGGSVTVALSNIYATPTPTTDPSTPTTAPTESSEPTSSSEPTDTSAPTESSETDSTGGDDGSSGGPLTGSLIINKTISGASLSELGAIAFVLTDTSCGATRDVPALTLDNVQCGLWGDAGNGTYYCIVEGLSAGITYTVTESADGQTATYSLNASSSVTSASAAIVANETSSVSLTDVYVPTGSTVPTEPGVESSETTAPGEGGETTEGTTAPVPEVVTVTLSDGTTLNPDCYTVNSDGTITLTAAGRNVLGAGRHQVTITFADGTTITQTLIVDSADRVGATGENDINVFAAIILLTSAALVFSAKKLREEEV